MRDLSAQEMAILLGTRESENCQTLYELSQNAETDLHTAAETVDGLVAKGILETVDSFDGIRYGYPANDQAQDTYATIHRIER